MSLKRDPTESLDGSPLKRLKELSNLPETALKNSNLVNGITNNGISHDNISSELIENNGNTVDNVNGQDNQTSLGKGNIISNGINDEKIDNQNHDINNNVLENGNGNGNGNIAENDNHNDNQNDNQNENNNNNQHENPSIGDDMNNIDSELLSQQPNYTDSSDSVAAAVHAAQAAQAAQAVQDNQNNQHYDHQNKINNNYNMNNMNNMNNINDINNVNNSYSDLNNITYSQQLQAYAQAESNRERQINSLAQFNSQNNSQNNNQNDMSKNSRILTVTSEKPLTGSDEWQRIRRENHKEVERRRRENINAGIRELAALLPTPETNKAQILKRAVEYIRRLKENETNNVEKWTLEKLLTDQAVAELGSSNDKLKVELERTYRELKKYKKLHHDLRNED